MPLANPRPNGPRFAKVINTEEKGSDVNLATPARIGIMGGRGRAAGIGLPQNTRPMPPAPDPGHGSVRGVGDVYKGRGISGIKDISGINNVSVITLPLLSS